MNKYTKIISSGSYLPKKILTNKELESRVDTSDEWICLLYTSDAADE